MSTEIMKGIDNLADTVKAYRTTAEADNAALRERIEAIEAKADRPHGQPVGKFTREQKEHSERFAAWLRRPREGSICRQLDEAQAELESKALLTTGSGGYAVPEVLLADIDERATALNPFRSLVRVVNVGSRDFKALMSRNDLGNAWVGEAGTRNETGISDLLERAPTFGTVYAYPKASEESMMDVFFDVQAWLVQEAGDGFAVAETTAIVSGNGSAKPTGFLNTTPVTTVDAASPQRAPQTLEYFPFLVGSPNAPRADALIDLSLSIKERYLLDSARVAWVMSRGTAALIRKLKDENGQYLWQTALQQGQPNLLCGYPVHLTDAMPAATSNLYPIAFGNWSRGYILADRVGSMRITVDDNISLPGYTKFYMRRVVGGCVYNCEAVKLLKYAAT